MHTDYDYLYKCVLCGESGTGKSQFVNIFSDKPFIVDSRSTIGVEFSNRIINVRNKRLKLQLWDTAGQERYRAITSAYYRGNSLTFLFFDLNNKQSFEKLNKWIEEIKCYSEPNTIIILIGNKCDLNHNVLKEEIDNFIKVNDCSRYYEISCKNNPEKILNLLDDVSHDLLGLTKNTKVIENEHFDSKTAELCERDKLYNELRDNELKEIEISKLKSENKFLYFCLFFIMSVFVAFYFLLIIN